MTNSEDENEDEPAPTIRSQPKVEEPLTIRKQAMPVPQIPSQAARPDTQAKRTDKTGAVDTAGIRTGTTLRHKAFGKGVVHTVDRQYISVNFGGTIKKFKFPGAIQDGFLEIV